MTPQRDSVEGAVDVLVDDPQPLRNTVTSTAAAVLKETRKGKAAAIGDTAEISPRTAASNQE
ncbi:MAG TPA: hypothetical protein VD833_05255 [Vicinamibacterales bacterium]|nr:hypothetical protein [Vicinamibacterales bacterium]